MFIGAIISVISTVATAAVSISDSIENAKVQKISARYNFRLQQNQATALESANVRETAFKRLQLSQSLANQEAIMATKGMSLESKSALDIFDDTKLANKFDEQNALYNTNQKASALRSGARLSLYNGLADARSSKMQAAATGIQAVGTVAEKWYKMSSSGG